MRHNNKLYFLLGVAVVLLASCSKKEKSLQPSNTGTMLDVIKSFYKLQNTKVDGSVLYQSNLCNNDAKLTDIVQASGIFYDTAGSRENGNGGSIIIGNHKLVTNSFGTYENEGVTIPQVGLYGTNVTFSVTAPRKHIPRLSANGIKQSSNSRTSSIDIDVNSSPTISATLYMPTAINITNVPASNVVTLSNGLPTTITWNADPNNTIGVIIIAEYFPEFFNNKTSYLAGNKQFIRAAMNVPDNGSTDIPWSFFSQFPQGGHITLWVGRGNFAIASDGTYNYSVGGYTATAIWDLQIPVPTTMPGIFTTVGGNTAGTVSSLAGAVSFTNLPVQISQSDADDIANATIFIGTISGTGCVPQATRTFNCGSMGTMKWEVTVYNTGEVYVHWIGGMVPVGATSKTISGQFNL